MSARGRIGFLLHPGEQPAVQQAVARAQACGYDTWTAVDNVEVVVAENAAGTVLLVTIGGDGTFLFGARLAAPRGIPVIGANRGRLGFLNDIEIDKLPEAISRFAAGEFRTQLRSLIEASTSEGSEEPPALAVNEIVVRACDVNVVRLRVEADHDLVGEFDADGVVVATATGSTAYALSAGGPPVDPRVRALVVVPLAPHAVISRPVVIPEAVTVEVLITHGDVFVAADGRSIARMNGGGVTVRPGPELELIRFTDSPSFQARLRQKFRFGVPHKEFGAAHQNDDTIGFSAEEAPGGQHGAS